MNIKKVAMMLTIMLITILSASSFYVLTGEAELNQIITVNSPQTEDGIVKGKDYEKVYGEGPYTETSGKYKDQKYYIRYTGDTSHKTVIDLYNADQKDTNGKPLGGYDVTKKDDGSIKILNTTITSTYKMFSKRKGGTNTEITRVFIPSSIAINGDKDLSGELKNNNGIASNTFEGYADSIVEKDVIYHTGNVLTNISGSDARGEGITASYNRTTKIDKTTYPNITTYVYLGDENVVRDSSADVPMPGNSYDYQYKGSITNVFVSNEVNYPVGFFCRASSHNGLGTLIDYVLLDDGKRWFANSMGITTMFYNQTNLQLTDNFRLPSQIYQGKNSGTVNELGLTTLFASCTRLSTLPKDFKIPEGVTNIEGMFLNCPNLKGIIELPTSASYIVDPNGVWGYRPFLGNAGTNASNYGLCNTPIIVKYPLNNKEADNYTDNVYTPQTPGGKVTMIPITNNNDTTQWEKVYEPGAPNYDEGGAYYIRYKGTDTTVYMDSIERDDKGVNNKDFDIEFSAGTKNPCILDTKLRSTYKMFSKGEEGVEITRVFIPSAIAINGDKNLSGNLLDNNGIASNTFEGYEDSKVEKDVIYHTGSIGPNYWGYNITTSHDRTTKISKADNAYPHVTTYVYLGNENVARDSSVDVPMPGTYYDYQYKGSISNVFVSNEVNYPIGFFCRAASHNGMGSYIGYVLLDDGDRWFDKKMGLSAMFYNQIYLRLTDNFKLPNKIYQGTNALTVNEHGLISLFSKCSSLTRLPNEFVIPEGITNMVGTFFNDSNLQGTIYLPRTASDFTDCFTNAGKTATGYSTKTPIILKVWRGSTAASVLKSSAYITVEYRDDETSSQSSINNAIVNVQESTNKIVIEDCTEEISVKVNEVNSQKLTVEDETDYVSVTVNKNVEENKTEEDEVQE